MNTFCFCFQKSVKIYFDLFFCSVFNFDCCSCQTCFGKPINYAFQLFCLFSVVFFSFFFCQSRTNFLFNMFCCSLVYIYIHIYISKLVKKICLPLWSATHTFLLLLLSRKPTQDYEIQTHNIWNSKGKPTSRCKYNLMERINIYLEYMFI